MEESLKTSGFVFSVLTLLAVIVIPSGVCAAQSPVDASIPTAPVMYVPTPADLAYTGVTTGDVAQVDIQSMGPDVGFAGLVLNSDGVSVNAPHLFIKIQEQDGTGNFEYGACYLGFNGSAGAFGLGFFPLTQQFWGARLRATRTGSSVTIQLTDVNGGALPNQTYVCAGAPLPAGNKLGINGLHGIKVHTPRLDNWGNGSIVLDQFNFVLAFGATGNWTDAVIGMHSHILHYAEASDEELPRHASMSFWKGPAGLTAIRPTSGAQGTALNVTLTGSHFQLPGTTVNVSGSGVTVTNVNLNGDGTTTSFTAHLVIDPAAPTGPRTVTVTTPNGTSSSVTFNVTSSLFER
jgi:hypothetical protein